MSKKLTESTSAELEAESKPEPTDFTKEFRHLLQRGIGAGQSTYEAVWEFGERACDLIDSLQEQLKEFKYWHDQLRNRYAALANKSVRRSEQLAAKDAAAKAATGHLTGEDCQRIAEQALKGGE